MNNRLTLTIPRNLWMSSNRPITNHGQRTSIKDGLHALAAREAEARRLTARDRPVMTVWTIRYPKGTGWVHGDAANAHPTCKAILDGLTAKGYLVGDGPRHVIAETYRRGPNLDQGDGLHAVVLELVDAAAVESVAGDVAHLVRERQA